MPAPSFSLVDIARRGGQTFRWFDAEGTEREFLLPNEDAVLGGVLVDAIDIRGRLADVETTEEADALVGELRAKVNVLLRMADPEQLEHMLPLSYAMLGSVLALASGGASDDTPESVAREAVDAAGDTDQVEGQQSDPPTLQEPAPEPAAAASPARRGSPSRKRSPAPSTA